MINNMLTPTKNVIYLPRSHGNVRANYASVHAARTARPSRRWRSATPSFVAGAPSPVGDPGAAAGHAHGAHGRPARGALRQHHAEYARAGTQPAADAGGRLAAAGPAAHRAARADRVSRLAAGDAVAQHPFDPALAALDRPPQGLIVM